MSEVEESTPPDGLTLRTTLSILRRRAGIVLACALLVPAVALAVSLAQEKRYTATASLLFRDPALDEKLFGSTFIQQSGDPAREAATNLRLVSLDVVAARTARALGGRLDTGAVAEAVDVTAEGQSDVASVSATDPSPRFAARIADTFAEQYLAFRRAADRAKIEEALTLVRRQLQRLSPTERTGPRGRSLESRGEELQILASLQTGNAELVQRAREPTAPSSPMTRRNVALGLVLGLLLGVALAFVRERLDRRLRDPQEAERIFSRPLLAVVPESSALAQAGPACETGLPASEGEAFRMLRANLQYFNVDHAVRSVVVTSAAPGDGKSTVAWNLALAAASAGVRVLLIEADLRHPSLAASAEHLHPAPGLSTVLAGQTELVDAVQTISLDQSSDVSTAGRTLEVLAAGPIPPNPVDLIESQRMREILRRSENAYGLVVIDTSPTLLVPDAVPLVKEVSGVLVVTRLGHNTRDGLAQLRNQLDNLDARTLGVVANGVRLGRARGYGYGYGYGYSDNGAVPSRTPASPPSAR